jgi:hypothetical protein
MKSCKGNGVSGLFQRFGSADYLRMSLELDENRVFSLGRGDLLRIGQIIERVRRRTRLPVGRLLAVGAEVVQASTQQAHGWQYQPTPTGSEQGRSPQPKFAESQRQAEQVAKKRKVVAVKPASPAERAATRLKSTPASESRTLKPRPARSEPRRRKRGSAGPGIAKSRAS